MSHTSHCLVLDSMACYDFAFDDCAWADLTEVADARFSYSDFPSSLPTTMSILQIDLFHMLLKLATTLLAASSIARADQSAPSDAAQKFTANIVTLALDNPKRRTNASGSIRAAASNKTGAECSFVELLPDQQMGADLEVLKCEDSESCVKDTTSPLGGRCVSKDDVAGSLVVDSHRRLAECSGTYAGCVECTMSDGITASKKCDGSEACVDRDPDTVSCGSCNGNRACTGSVGPIGEGSCNGDYACNSHPREFFSVSKYFNEMQFV